MAQFGRTQKLMMKFFSNVNRIVYQKSGGKLGGKFPMGAPILLLTTIGRKSGKPRTQPLLYLRDGDKCIVVASKGGYDHHPLWYLNLKNNPAVDVEIKKEKQRMHAADATDEEYAFYWPKLCSIYSGYEKYVARTERKIPVVVLWPR